MTKWDMNKNTFAWNPFRCNNAHISNNGNKTRKSLRTIYHSNHFIIVDILYLHTNYCIKSVMRCDNVSCLVEVKIVSPWTTLRSINSVWPYLIKQEHFTRTGRWCCVISISIKRPWNMKQMNLVFSSKQNDFLI